MPGTEPGNFCMTNMHCAVPLSYNPSIAMLSPENNQHHPLFFCVEHNCASVMRTYCRLLGLKKADNHLVYVGELLAHF